MTTTDTPPLLARAHRCLARLDASASRERFNARQVNLANKLRAQIAMTEDREGPILANNPQLTGLAYFLRDYGQAIESACWEGV